MSSVDSTTRLQTPITTTITKSDQPGEPSRIKVLPDNQTASTIREPGKPSSEHESVSLSDRKSAASPVSINIGETAHNTAQIQQPPSKTGELVLRTESPDILKKAPPPKSKRYQDGMTELKTRYGISQDKDTKENNLLEVLNACKNDKNKKLPPGIIGLHDEDPTSNPETTIGIQQTANTNYAKNPVEVLTITNTGQNSTTPQYWATLLLPSRFNELTDAYQSEYKDRFNELIESPNSNIQRVKTFYPEQTQPLTPKKTIPTKEPSENEPSTSVEQGNSEKTTLLNVNNFSSDLPSQPTPVTLQDTAPSSLLPENTATQQKNSADSAKKQTEPSLEEKAPDGPPTDDQGTTDSSQPAQKQALAEVKTGVESKQTETDPSEEKSTKKKKPGAFKKLLALASSARNTLTRKSAPPPQTIPKESASSTAVDAPPTNDQDATDSSQTSAELNATLEQGHPSPTETQNTLQHSAAPAGDQGATDSPQPAKEKPTSELETGMKSKQPKTDPAEDKSTKQEKPGRLKRMLSFGKGTRSAKKEDRNTSTKEPDTTNVQQPSSANPEKTAPPTKDALSLQAETEN